MARSGDDGSGGAARHHRDRNGDYGFEFGDLGGGPDIAINRSVEDLNNIDSWSERQHTESGLMDKVRASKIGINEAERQDAGFCEAVGWQVGGAAVW